MSDRPALIEAIRANPEEDTPRLVLADWYEENGDAARAEFIRVQCELARLDPSSDRYPELHLRQLQIQAEHEREWLGDWADRLVRWEFRRGMLDEVTIQPESYCQGGAELFREHPIWRVAFVDELGESLGPSAIRDVLSQPHSRFLRAIDAAACKSNEQAAAMFGGEIHTNTWLRELARAAAINQLRELSLFGGTRGGRDDIDLKDWQAFCAAEHLRGLTDLDLSNIYDYHGRSADWEPVLREVATARFAPGLRNLRFDGCHVGPDALLHLTRSRRFQHLQNLTVGGHIAHLQIPSILPELLEPDFLPSLRDLTIPYGRHLVEVMDHSGWGRIERLGLVGIDDHRERSPETHGPIWRAFLHSPHVRPKAFLVESPGYYSLGEVGFWDELTSTAWFGGLRELAVVPYDQSCAALFDRSLESFPHLRSLTLNSDTELIKRLAAWPGLADLVELGLHHSHSSAAPEAAERLFHSPHLTPRLTTLRVSALCRSAEAVVAFAKCRALAGVTHLDFAFNDLSPESAAMLAASSRLKYLRSLHTWSEGEENDTGAWLHLADPHALPQLRDVVVGSGTTESVQEELRRRFGPRLRVFSDC